MEDFLNKFILSFIPIFVALDAIGNIPFFMSLTEGLTANERRRVADVTSLVSTIIIVIFMLTGRAIFQLMGISVSDFRIAGGILLLALSMHMLIVGKHFETRPSEIAIFPLASPLIAGPAVLTTTLILVGTRGWQAALASLIVNMVILWLLLRNAHRVEAFVGRQGARAFSKVVEILLAAIAVNMIRSGIETAVSQFMQNTPV